MADKVDSKRVDERSKGTVLYSPHCARGDIIALLYNHATREKSGLRITPEVAEDLVHKQLGDARTIDGRVVPSEEGFIDKIKGVPLNVYCYEGMIDVSEYPHGDGKKLIYEFISECRRDFEIMNARLNPWEPIN